MPLFNWNIPRFSDSVKKSLRALETMPNVTTAEICLLFVNLHFYLPFYCCVVQITFSGEVRESFELRSKASFSSSCVRQQVSVQCLILA